MWPNFKAFFFFFENISKANESQGYGDASVGKVFAVQA